MVPDSPDEIPDSQAEQDAIDKAVKDAQAAKAQAARDQAAKA